MDSKNFAYFRVLKCCPSIVKIKSHKGTGPGSREKIGRIGDLGLLFNSFTYLLFLPLVTLLYWLAPQRLRYVILLAASYVFYMSWMKIYGFLLLGLSTANFLIAILLHKTEKPDLKRLVLISGLTVNLACLALFKYTNFLIDSARCLCDFVSSSLHIESLPVGSLSELPIILPLGISFFVFEFIHYLVDIFKGAKPITSPVRFGLFAAFFPSQIAGPIKRFQDFEEQLLERAKFDKSLFKAGVYLIAQGMFKKVALGDNLAPIVQVGFSRPELMGTFDAWLCVFAFALQIYYDFSGYTDIGRGSAMLLGFRLPENFNMPYFASSLRDFWHRWHISLSTWLRDYLYIPLGGSRKGKSSSAINLLITMLLGGLWHGASWHFVVWGAFHGLGLAINRIFDEAIARNPALKRMTDTFAWNSFAHVFTFIMVCLGWVVFRANSMTEAISVYQGLFTLRESTTAEATITDLVLQSALPVALSLYAIAFAAIHQYPRLRLLIPAFSRLRSIPIPAQAIGLTAFGLLVLGLAPQKSIPFIYFQF